MSTKNTVTLMTEGDHRRLLLKFAVPVFFGNLFQVLYTTIDSMVVGNFLGPEALAAISSTNSLINLMIGIFLGFATGASVVIGHLIGSGNKRQTSNAVHSTTALGLVFSVLLTLLGVFGVNTFLHWMGVPEDVMPQAVAYLRIYFAGSLALIMYNIFTGILQAAGNSRDPLIYLIVSSVLNIILDLLFVAGFHMGVGGAALATVLAQLVSALLSMRRLMLTEDAIQLKLRKIRLEKTSTRAILKMGFPSSIEWGVTDFANVLIQSYINSFGAMAMAGIGAAWKIEGFTFLPITAMRAALGTYVSQNYGAGEYERISQGIRFGIGSSVVLIGVIGVITMVGAAPMIRLFTSDPEVIAFGCLRLRICGLFFWVLGFSNIMSSVICSLGKPVPPMFTTLLCWCGVRVLTLMTIGRWWHHLELALWIYPVTWTLSATVFLLYYLHLKKTLMKTA